MLPTIVILRHGATDFDTGEVERVSGWTDVPLNERGEEEAERAGDRLADSGVTVARIVTSDLTRAEGTARRLARHVGDPQITLDKGLRPWDLGDLTGRPTKETMPDVRHLCDYEEEEAPGGESFIAFQSRAFSVLLPLLEDAKSHPDAGVVVVVSHSPVARLIKSWMAAGAPPDGTIDMQAFIASDGVVAPGQFSVLQWNGQSWDLADEGALRPEDKTKESSMPRDPYEILGEQVIREIGFDWGGLATGAINTAGNAAASAEADKAAGKAKSDSAAAVQKSIAADVAWANAEAMVEVASKGDPASQTSAHTMRDLAKDDADTAAAALQGDGIAKRCQAAKDALRNAATAASKSPNKAEVQARFHAWQLVSNACSTGSGSGGGTIIVHHTSSGENWLTTRYGGLPVYGWGIVGVGGVTLLTILAKMFGGHKGRR